MTERKEIKKAIYLYTESDAVRNLSQQFCCVIADITVPATLQQSWITGM